MERIDEWKALMEFMGSEEVYFKLDDEGIKFDMNHWKLALTKPTEDGVEHCGYSACAIGSGIALGLIKDMDLHYSGAWVARKNPVFKDVTGETYTDFEAICQYFDIEEEEAHSCFSDPWTPSEVAYAMKEVLEYHGEA